MAGCKKRKWSNNLLNLTFVNDSHMPSLVEGSEPTAYLSNAIKNKFGFKKNIIVAGGGGDQAAGAIGSGVINSKQSMISLGTSGVYFSPTSEFSSNTNQAVHSFCHCLPNTWHHMSVMLSATNCLNWISKMHGLQISDAISKAKIFFKESFMQKSMPYFLPYLSGERTPHNDSNARGVFFGLHLGHLPGHLTRAVLEGVCFALRDSFELIRALGLSIESVLRVSL